MTSAVLTLLTIIFVAALSAPLLATTVTYLDRRRVLRGTCGGSDSSAWPIAVGAFVFESAAMVLSIGAPAIRAIAPPPAVSRDRRHLVILVAGDGLRPSSFWLLERRLRRLGWHTAAVDVGERPGSPDRAAEDVGEQIVRTREKSDCPVVSVLAFGCAGLLVRRWLRDQAAGIVDQFITLGTPHQGTLGLLSRLGRFRFVHPSSSFLRDIAEGDPVPRRFDTIAISSELDAWVFPNDAAYYPGAFNIAVRDSGHFALLWANRIAELVTENLTTANAAHRK